MRRLFTTLMAVLAIAPLAWGQTPSDARSYGPGGMQRGQKVFQQC